MLQIQLPWSPGIPEHLHVSYRAHTPMKARRAKRLWWGASRSHGAAAKDTSESSRSAPQHGARPAWWTTAARRQDEIVPQPAGAKCLAERKWFPKSKCLLDTDSKPSSCQLLVQKRVELEIKFSLGCCFHTLSSTGRCAALRSIAVKSSYVKY